MLIEGRKEGDRKLLNTKKQRLPKIRAKRDAKISFEGVE